MIIKLPGLQISIQNRIISIWINQRLIATIDFINGSFVFLLFKDKIDAYELLTGTENEIDNYINKEKEIEDGIEKYIY